MRSLCQNAFDKNAFDKMKMDDGENAGSSLAFFRYLDRYLERYLSRKVSMS